VAACLMIAAVASAWGAWTLAKSRSHQLFGRLVTRVDIADSMVALTFDDGPVAGYTDSVLATLYQANVPATFFVVGTGLAAHPEIAERIVRDRHELGNHSYSHRRLIFKRPSHVRAEIERTDSLIRVAGHSGAIHFRPPYGKRLVILPWILSRTGRATILWDLEPDSDADVAHDADRIVDHVMQRVRPGSIILLHVETPGRAAGRAALPKLIERLRAAGYQFATVSHLLRLNDRRRARRR